MLLWFVSGVFGIVPEVLKMFVFFVFPVLGVFVGWFIFLYFGFGRFRCFCVFVFVFIFCVVFVSVLFVLFLFWCWIVFGVGFCFVLVFVFFVLCFGGFKVQVRWPKGPPHLAINPPYFLYFSVFCFS